MDFLHLGKPGAIPPVEEITPMDKFENAIRAIGVRAACEWFDKEPDGEFAMETIRVLVERSKSTRG